MKTKVLIVGAAALAMGVAASANAQDYSTNFIGYVTVSVTNGYTMVANQLDLDGTGTNNSIYTVLGTNLPVNTTVEVWNGSAFVPSKWLASGHWQVNSQLFTNAMNPGGGFLIECPANTSFIEAGTMIQGTNNYPVVAGYQVVAPNAPLTGGIASTFGYTPSKGDIVEVWNGVGFGSHKWNGTSWTGGGEPVFSIGQSMVLNAVSNNTWTQVVTVQ